MIKFNVILILMLAIILTPFNTGATASSPDYHYWVYASKNGTELISVMLDDPSENLPIELFESETYQILGIRSSENGRSLLLTIQDNAHKALWSYDMETKKRNQLAVFPRDTSIPYNDISKDGQWVVFFGTYNDRMESWLMSLDGTYIRALGSQLEGSYARAPAFSWDSQSIAYVYGSSRILFVEELLSGKTIQLTQNSLGPAWNPYFLPGDQDLYVMITPYRQQMSIYKVNRNTLMVKKLWETEEAVVGAIPSKNRSKTAIMTISTDGKFWKLWQMHEDKPEPWFITSQVRTGNTFSMQVSFDGQWLLFRCDGQNIRISNLERGSDSSLHHHLGMSFVSFAAFYIQNPFPPFLSGFSLEKTINMIEWDWSHKGSLPVSKFQLFRKKVNPDAPWELIAHVNTFDTSYKDQLVENDLATYLYRMRVIDSSGNASLWSNTVLIDRTPPLIEIISPPEKQWLASFPGNLEGKVNDHESGIMSFYCNNEEISFDVKGDFSIPLVTKEGKNPYYFKAVDNAGNYTEMVYEIWIDTQAPEITFEYYHNEQELLIGTKQLMGKTFDAESGIASFTINDRLINLNDQGSFTYTMEIKKGMNLFMLKAVDIAGHSTITTLELMGLEPVHIQCWIGSQDYTVNGSYKKMDAEPYIHYTSGRTMVPVRFMVEPVDSTIEFDPEDQIIHIKRYRTYIICQIGKPSAMVNGMEIPIDPLDSTLCPLIKDQRTYLPLRFIAEHLGFKVTWNSQTEQIDLSFPYFNS